jgi:predicted secreted protein
MGSPAPHMVMIQVVSLGFEGNNLRWLAVPVKP